MDHVSIACKLIHTLFFLHGPRRHVYIQELFLTSLLICLPLYLLQCNKHFSRSENLVTVRFHMNIDGFFAETGCEYARLLSYY